MPLFFICVFWGLGILIVSFERKDNYIRIGKFVNKSMFIVYPLGSTAGQVALSCSGFPNPAKDCFYITVGDEIKINKIELINTLGSLVFSVIPTQNKISVATNHLASGMYYVNIHTDLSLIRKKVYIE